MPKVWLLYLQSDTPIILDLSDLAKRLAKKMDYLATVRDGSTAELVNGYRLLELYALLSRKNPVPILLEPFSHEQPYSPGQNPIVLKAIHKVFELTGNRGVLVVDRGFDAGVMFEDWLDNKYRFVACLVGKRHLLRFSGDIGHSNDGHWVPIQARQITEQTLIPHRFCKLIKRKIEPTFRSTTVSIPHDFKVLARIAAQWLWTGPAGRIPEDLNSNGVVNLADVVIFANNWIK